MHSATHSVPASEAGPIVKARLVAGAIMTALPVMFLLFDSIIKVLNVAPVVESFARLGYPGGHAPVIGILELFCIALYSNPRTSFLGAILLTGFLGGAVATHLRVGDPFLTHTLFPFYVGVLVWGGLALRDDRLRAVIPLRR